MEKNPTYTHLFRTIRLSIFCNKSHLYIYSNLYVYSILEKIAYYLMQQKGFFCERKPIIGTYNFHEFIGFFDQIQGSKQMAHIKNSDGTKLFLDISFPENFPTIHLFMPSPSADSKFVLSKLFGLK